MISLVSVIRMKATRRVNTHSMNLQVNMTTKSTWPDSIEEYIVSAFKSASIHTPKDILSVDEQQLSKLTGLSVKTCKTARKAAVNLFAVPGESAADFLACRVVLPCGMGDLDAALDGGLGLEWLVEIYGEAGSGKTQFCLTLAASTIARGQRVFWIDSEGDFRPNRLVEILDGRSASMDNLSVAKCNTVAEFLACIESVGMFCENTEIPPLMIIDSIAAILKGSEMSKKELCDIAETLKSMKCFVVCSNQVVADFAAVPGSETYKPSLGSTWSHLVTCRFLIDHVKNERNERIIHVLKSPTCGPSIVSLRMTGNGLQ